MRMGPHMMMPSDSTAVKGRKIDRSSLARVWQFARPYKVSIIGFLVSILLAAAIALVPPFVFRAIIDDAIPSGNRGRIWWLASFAIAAALFDAVLAITQRWYSSRIGEGLIYDLRVALFDKVQRMPVAFFTRTQTGSLISRVNGDVIGAQQAFTSTLSGIISNGISLIIVLSTMLILSWQITLTSLILLPVFLIPAKSMGKRVQALSREQMNLNAAMSQTMTERFNVSGALLVKLFGDPKNEGNSFYKKAARVKDIGVRIAMTNTIFFVALTTVATIATAIVYGFGGSLVVSGVLTLGTLLALTALLARLYGPLTALSNVRVDIMTALVSFERVFEVLDLEPLVKDSKNPLNLPQGPLNIEFNNVAFSYPTRADVGLETLELASDGKIENDTNNLVLNNVSFKIKPGTMLALVGPSGSGKTTISQLIARLYDPTSGVVTVGEVDIKEVARDEIRKTIGVVTQDSHLFHDSIKNNLLYAKEDATETEIWSALESAQISDFVNSLPDKLDTIVGDRGYRLSGGEKQRIAIARVFLKQPRIVILDEATAHLDNENEAAVQVALATVLENRTSVVIAHRLSTIINAEQIAVIKDGKLIAIGSHANLLKDNGVYSDLYNQQFAV